MNDLLTLAIINARTGIRMNRLRYIADSDVLPDNRVQKEAPPQRPGRGVTRLFRRSEAFAMVIAIQLLDAGIRRAAVARIMDIMRLKPAGAARRDLSNMPLVLALTNSEVQWLEIGDGVNFRMSGESKKLRPAVFEEWIQIETRAKLSNYVPLVVVRINVSRLRELVR